MYLLEQVLLIGKSDSGKLQCYPTQFNLKELCHEVVESLQLHSDRPSIEFSYMGDNVDATLDPALIRQILINLLSNAIKYSPKHQPIRLTVNHQDSAIVLQVQDQGIGIPLDEQAHLFDLFYRCSNVQSIRGSGLGLAVVKTCVDAHNGKIQMTSQLGEGTTITITFPHP
jgi:hypothetical protein